MRSPPASAARDLPAMPAARAARYVAKYATKGYTERREVPWKYWVLEKGDRRVEAAKIDAIARSRTATDGA